MNRALVFLVCVTLGGCIQRWVDAPSPSDEGSFLVHVVRSSDESLPKIMTWYSGTTLSQQLVIKYNPFLLQRDVMIGDKIIIPIEIVANDKAFGDASEQSIVRAPNLLMGESATPTPVVQKTVPSQKANPAQSINDLPTMRLETFNDDTNPDAAQPETEGKAPAPVDRVRQLQKEITDRQQELESLQAHPVDQAGDMDMPPPGLLQEYEGS